MAMSYTPTVADIEAAGVVLDDVIELSDSCSVEDAVDWRQAIVALQQKCRDAIGLLDTQLLNTMESDYMVRGDLTVERKVRKEKQRFDHGRIASAVQARAMYDGETGERLDGEQAVKEAVHMMRKLYVAPATKAKTTILDELGIPRGDVEEWEWGGREVRIERRPT